MTISQLFYYKMVAFLLYSVDKILTNNPYIFLTTWMLIAFLIAFPQLCKIPGKIPAEIAESTKMCILFVSDRTDLLAA